MKRILLSLAALAAIFPAARAQQHADTLIVNRPDKVTVITSAETQEIRIKGSDKDPDYNYVGRITLTPDATVAVQDGPDLFGFDIFKMRKKSPAPVQRKQSRISTEGLERVNLGFTDALESPGGIQLAPRVFSDLELSLLNLHFRPFREVLEFSTGVDLGYRALALSGGNQFVFRDGIVGIQPMDGKYSKQKSSLRYNYVGMPLYVSLLFGRYNRLSFGVAGHYNFMGRIRDKYIEENGARQSYKTENLPLNKLSWEYCLRLDLDEFGAYVKYSPCPVLAEGKGPSFHTLSFGLSLNVSEW